jgi:hypothetical protein
MELENDRALDVRSREDLADLIALLVRDFEQHGTEWENPRLDMYLDSLGSWVGSLDNLYRNRGEELPESPTWELVARMLLVARYYE